MPLPLWRQGLEHLDGIPIPAIRQCIRDALWIRWPMFREVDREARRNMVKKIQRVMASEHARQDAKLPQNPYDLAREAAGGARADPRVVAWRINDVLRSPGARKAARWLVECMESNDKNAWLVDTEYHQVNGRTDVEHFAWQIAFIDLKTGELLISTNIDYGGASAEEVWEQLYQRRPRGSPGFEVFRARFTSQDRYNSRRTNGLLPSTIEQQMRRKGFSLQTHKVVSWSGAIDMTATCKILCKNDSIAAERWSLDDLNRDRFNSISIMSLVREMVGTADNTLPAVFGRMFFGQNFGTFHTAECDVKAMWKILSRLYE